MSDCCCSPNDYGVEESPQFYVNIIRKARKEHRCCECGGVIKKGEKYEIATICFDDMVSRYKTCLICLKIREDFFPCGFNHQEMREDFRTRMGFDYIGIWPEINEKTNE